MTEVEKELERFIASGKATTKVNSGRFQTTHIDPLKIAKHFAQWEKEEMMKDAIEGEVIDKGDFIKFADGKYIDLNPTMGAEPFVKFEDGDKVKVIIIKE